MRISPCQTADYRFGCELRDQEEKLPSACYYCPRRRHVDWALLLCKATVCDAGLAQNQRRAMFPLAELTHTQLTQPHRQQLRGDSIVRVYNAFVRHLRWWVGGLMLLILRIMNRYYDQ